jgi:hypothetical protein
MTGVSRFLHMRSSIAMYSKDERLCDRNDDLRRGPWDYEEFDWLITASPNECQKSSLFTVFSVFKGFSGSRLGEYIPKGNDRWKPQAWLMQSQRLYRCIVVNADDMSTEELQQEGKTKGLSLVIEWIAEFLVLTDYIQSMTNFNRRASKCLLKLEPQMFIMHRRDGDRDNNNNIIKNNKTNKSDGSSSSSSSSSSSRRSSKNKMEEQYVTEGIRKNERNKEEGKTETIEL